MTEADTKEFELMRDDAPAPAPDPAPQPDPKPDPDPKPAAADAPKPAPEAKTEKPTRLVPIDALHEEREKRKAHERRIAELERAVSQPPKPATDEDIDEYQDPIAAIAKLKAEIRAGKEREEEAKRTEQQLSEVAQRVGTRIQAYKAEHPEYDEQIQFLRRSRFDELTELGFDQAAAIRQMQGEEIQIGIAALQNDWDPGAKIAKMAILRGWQPKAAPSPQVNGAASPAANPDAEARLARLEKGQKAAVSSSSGGGSGPEADTTLEEGLRLKGAAFDAWWTKNAERLMN